jgi:hypothetical protein
MTNFCDEVLTRHHVAIHPAMRVAELRAQHATPIPDGYVPLGHRAFAEKLGVKPRMARYHLERLVAIQHREDVLRVVRLPVPTGKGALRPALHVLWPVAPTSAAA